MTTYEDLYFYLFGAIAEALEDLERGEVMLAINRLVMAQQEAEDRILEVDIVSEVCESRLLDFLQVPEDQLERFAALEEVDNYESSCEKTQLLL